MRRNYKQLFFFFGLVFLVCLSNCTFLEKPYDLVIKNGFIIDGTGNPWFKSDIGLKKQKIIRIGFIDESQAKKSIDAQNLFIFPGFIDTHSHCNCKIAEVPTVADKATFPNPHQYSQGLMYVIVNGELVVEKGKHTGGLPGMVLYGYGKNSGERK